VAATAAQEGVSHLGVGAIPDCHAAFIVASAGRASRYCVKQCPAKANVTAQRNHRRPAAGCSSAG
jgi:hypothetical protein